MKKKSPLKEVDLGFAKIDLERESNQGFGEVIFAERKTVDQVLKIARVLKKKNGGVLITRCSPDQMKALKKEFPKATHNQLARVVRIGGPAIQVGRGISIGVLAAGTSDLSVAEESSEVLA
ncbi:MAG: 1-(5-phosphoribosyl)-5-amino-4-imidazole-carboxylate carboxylase, partial [Verrucomicrobiota bacterium]